MNTVTEFVIDRKIWLRGEGNDNSYLLREEDSKKCCIGILCNAVGFKDEEIIGRASVVFDKNSNTKPECFLIVESFPIPDNRLADYYEINDDEYFEDFDDENGISDDEFYLDKEEKLTERFAEDGITVKFIN